MTSRSEFLIGPTSDYETWRTGFRSVGVFSSQDLESKVFKASILGLRLWGLLRSNRARFNL
jgi:AraC family transcriptional activator of tynA and feaB